MNLECYKWDQTKHGEKSIVNIIFYLKFHKHVFTYFVKRLLMDKITIIMYVKYSTFIRLPHFYYSIGISSKI